MGLTPAGLTGIVDQAAGYSKRGSPYASSWNGPGGISLRRIEALIELTGVPAIRATTFWALAPVLAQMGLRSSLVAMRWCPVCIQDQPSRPMERLAWTIGMVSACSVHGVALEDQCPTCGAHQLCGRAYRLRRRCSSCGNGLAHAGTAFNSPRFYHWIDQVIEELIAYSASESTASQIPLSNLITFVDLLKIQRPRDQPLPRWITHPSRTEGRASIVTLVNLAAYQGVTPLEILLSPHTAAAPRLWQDERAFCSVPLSPHVTGNMDKAAQCLTELCNGPFGLLPALDVVLRQFKAGRTTFRAAFPQLCQRYGKAVAQHRTYAFNHQYSRSFKIACHLLSQRKAHRLVINSRGHLVRSVAELARVDIALSVEAVSRAVKVMKWVRAAPQQEARTPIEDDVVATWATGFRR
jgi:hypothetical protein